MAVYMYLRDRSDAEGKCWPGIKTIASDMKLSRSTVKRALHDLEQHGYLKMCIRDRFGTMPPFDILPLFSSGRSRRLTLVPIIQSLAQLEKNYGKEGCEIIQDNCQDTIFGGFAPNSQTAEVLSKALGSRTVLSLSLIHI